MSKILYLPHQAIGSVRHYHHFLMGYYLPIFFDLEISNENYVMDCGCMNQIFQETPKANFQIYSGGYSNYQVVFEEDPDSSYTLKSYRGFDGPRTRRIHNIDQINDKINFIFDIDEENIEDEYILLIDRGQTPTKKEIKLYENLSKNKETSYLTYGNQRRTIINMDEVFECLNTIMPTKRVCLDKMGLKQQISLFRNATYVVSQHGAGLSNLFFCSNKCKGVVEFCNHNIPSEKIWFIGLANSKNLLHTQIPITQKHINIDTDMLHYLMKFLLSSN